MKKNLQIYLFIFVMCGISALILSTVSTSLKPLQIKAEETYRNKELLKAASLLPKIASFTQINELTKEKLTPMLTDSLGNIFTFEQKGIDYSTYLEMGAKSGYFMLPFKLFFQIKGGGIVLPVNGFGLWDAIYGYIGIDKNGFSIIGVSWYDQKETPGLGAEISSPSWGQLFIGKSLFHGKKLETFGLNFVPKEMLTLLPPDDKEYSIDAISGATITTQGVSHAIKTSLSPYIPLLRKIQKGTL